MLFKIDFQNSRYSRETRVRNDVPFSIRSKLARMYTILESSFLKRQNRIICLIIALNSLSFPFWKKKEQNVNFCLGRTKFVFLLCTQSIKRITTIQRLWFSSNFKLNTPWRHFGSSLLQEWFLTKCPTVWGIGTQAKAFSKLHKSAMLYLSWHNFHVSWQDDKKIYTPQWLYQLTKT